MSKYEVCVYKLAEAKIKHSLPEAPAMPVTTMAMIAKFYGKEQTHADVFSKRRPFKRLAALYVQIRDVARGDTALDGRLSWSGDRGSSPQRHVRLRPIGLHRCEHAGASVLCRPVLSRHPAVRPPAPARRAG